MTAALRAIWAVLAAIPAWIWAPLLALAIGVGCHERTGRQAAEIDAQRAIAGRAAAEAAQATERALAAESAAEAVTNSLQAQQDHAATQTRILDDLAQKDATIREWSSAYAAVVRGRARDAAGADQLRRDIADRVAAGEARDRAAATADAAASACARRAGELGELLGEGAGLAGEGAQLVDGLRARLDAARGIIASDRTLMGR